MRKSKHVLTAVIILLILDAQAINPDEWQGSRGKFLVQNWTVNLNIGFTSYYGDLSQYDGNFVEKLAYESKLAAGFKLTKYILPAFGISGQLIYGGFHSDFLPGHSFELKLLEYNLQANLDLLTLLFPGRFQKYGLEAYAGLGQFLFQTTVYSDPSEKQATGALLDGTPEFVYFFGGTFHFRVRGNFSINADLSIRQAQNDNIDKYISNTDFDYYSWFSIGISYTINSTFSMKRYRAQNKINKHPPVWR